jgi:hypothetical protein
MALWVKGESLREQLNGSQFRRPAPHNVLYRTGLDADSLQKAGFEPVFYF